MLLAGQLDKVVPSVESAMVRYTKVGSIDS